MGVEYEEHFVGAEVINPELETLLGEGRIPYGGIAIETPLPFQCSPQLEAVISYGLLNPNFTIDPNQEETPGIALAVADTAGAILIGQLMDNIYEGNMANSPDCFFRQMRGRLFELSIPDAPPPFATGAYLIHVERVLLDFFPIIMNSHLKVTLDKIEAEDNDDPYKILYNNIATASGLTPYEFIRRGFITDVNTLYALFEYIVRHAKEKIPLIEKQGDITREQAVIIFAHTGIDKGLGKNSKPIFRRLVNEGTPENPEVPADAILTKGKPRDRGQRAYSPYAIRDGKLQFVPSGEFIAALIVYNLQEVLDEARREENAIGIQTANGCPARPPRANGKPNGIKYVHKLATQVLEDVNMFYSRKDHM